MLNRGVVDVEISEEAWDDLSQIDNAARQAVEAAINKILVYGAVLPGLNLHRAVNYKDDWLGYLTQGRQAWRVVVNFRDESHGKIMIVRRIINHDEMERLYGC